MGKFEHRDTDRRKTVEIHKKNTMGRYIHMFGWRYWFNGPEFEQTPGDGKGQGYADEHDLKKKYKNPITDIIPNDKNTEDIPPKAKNKAKIL